VRGLGETVEKQMVGNKQMNHYLLRNGYVLSDACIEALLKRRSVRVFKDAEVPFLGRW